MKFIPVNRKLLVEKISDDATLELVPEEFRDTLSPFTSVRVLDVAFDCHLVFDPGDEIIVQTNGLEKIKTLKDDFLIVSENFVVGVLQND